MTYLRLALAVALGLQVSLAACSRNGTRGQGDAGTRVDLAGSDDASHAELPDAPVVEDADAAVEAEAGYLPADVAPAEAAPAAALLMDPASAVLKAPEGGLSAPVAFTVTNTRGTPTGRLQVTLGGPKAAYFRIVSETCSNVVLSPGATCTVVVVYAPLAGSSSGEGSLAVTDGTSRESATATLHGQGWSVDCPTLSGSPDLGVAPPGAVGAEVVFTVTNSCSDLAMTVGRVSVNPSPTVRISTDTCTGQTIAPAGTCLVGLQLAPAQGSTPAAIAGLLTVDTDQGTSSLTVTGNAVSIPRLLVTPTSLSFGAVTTGRPSARTVKVTYNGPSPSSPFTVSLAGVGAAQLSIVANTCDEPIPPGSWCEITVQYLPVDATGVVANLMVTDGTSSGIVPIVGTGISVAQDASLDTGQAMDAVAGEKPLPAPGG